MRQTLVEQLAELQAEGRPHPVPRDFSGLEVPALLIALDDCTITSRECVDIWERIELITDGANGPWPPDFTRLRGK